MGVLAWLARHPATVAFFALFVVAAGSSSWAKHETARARELQSQLTQATQTIAAMTRDIQTGERIANDYQGKIAKLNRALAARRVRQSVCVVPSTAASGSHGATSSREHVGQNGISDQWLYEFAAEAEAYRLRLIACQEWAGR
jgi:hypothetical protein